MRVIERGDRRFECFIVGYILLYVLWSLVLVLVYHIVHENVVTIMRSMVVVSSWRQRDASGRGGAETHKGSRFTAVTLY